MVEAGLLEREKEQVEQIERKRHKRMIFEYGQIFVIYAQNYIIDQLKKKGPKEMSGFSWGSKNLGPGPDKYGLTIQKDEGKKIFTFTKDKLIEGYGSREWKDRLLARIKEILKKIER